MKEHRNVRRLASALVVLIVASLPAWAKGAHTVSLAYPVSLGGTQIAAGNYHVSWVQHSPAATVTFTQGKHIVATAEAKWVARNTKYERNMVVFDTKPDGSRTILEIRFAGMSQALVFGDASPSS